MKSIKKYLKQSLSIICMLVLVINLIPINTANAETNSYLPKTKKADKVIVLDLSHDLKNKDGEAKEAYMAITSIQGIINRNNPVKIYLTHTPQEHDWTPFTADESQLNKGLIPVEKVYPILDYGKKYPVLSYLLKTYKDEIRGMIQVPQLSGKIVDGAVMAGVTAAGVENSILVSEGIEKYIMKEGYSFEVKANTRHFQNNIDSFDWAYEKYFARCDKTFVAQHTFTAFGGGMDDQFPIMYDYFISSQVFVFCLDGNDPAELAKLQSFLVPENYDPGTAVLGLPVDEGKGIACMQDEGYYIAIMYVPNLTVTSSFEYDQSQVKQPPKPTALQADNNTNYVAFFVTDGDSMGFPTNFMYEQMTTSPHRGEIPIGWSFNPHLIDLFPTLINFYSQNDYNSFYELVSSMNNGGSPKTEAGALTFKNRYINYMKQSQGIFQTINYFNDDDYINDLTKAINPYLLIKGYQGQTNGNDVEWGNIKDSNITFTTISGSTQGNAKSENIYQALKKISTTKSQENPSFTIVCVGDGRWSGDPASHVSEAIEKLKNDNPTQNYTFLRPTDLAATYKAYQGDQTVTIGNPKHVSLNSNQVIASISTDQSKVELITEETTSVKGYAMDNQGQYIPYHTLSYESLDNQIATVNQDGKITAIKEGITQIKISDNSIEAYIDVSVIGRKASSIAVDKQTFSTAVNGQVTIKAELYDQFGQRLPTPSFEWDSSDESIAKVTDGNVTGLSAGQAEIHITYDSITTTVQVNVLESAASITRIHIEPNYLEMYENDIYILNANAYDANNNEVFGFQPKWQIKDTEIASIDDDGYITGLAAGQTKVIATFGDSVSESIDLLIQNNNQQKITFEETIDNEFISRIDNIVNFEAEAFKGYGKQGNIQGKAIKLDNDRYEKAFTFDEKTILKSVKAYNPTQETITLSLVGGTNGSMSYKIAPHKTLTLKTNFKTETETYVIKTTNTDVAFGEFVYGQADPIPSTLSIDQGNEQISLSKDKYLNLTATLYDQNKNKMDYDSIEWSSDRNDIVSVDENGRITGVAVGSTFIYAKTRGLVASVLVYVTENNIDTIQTTPSALTYYVGDIVPLNALAFDKDKQELHFPVTWVSENENIVSIYNNNYAKAIHVGTTQIKAIISGEEKIVPVFIKEHPESDTILNFNEFNENEFVNSLINNRVTFEKDFWQIKENVPDMVGNAIHLPDENTGEKAFFFNTPTTVKSFKVHNPTDIERSVIVKTLDASLPKVEYIIPAGYTCTIYTQYTGQASGYAFETYYQMLIGEIVYTDTLETGFSNEDITNGLTTLTQPKFGQTQLELPQVSGFDISIAKTSHPDIISTDGIIDPIGIDQEVSVTLLVNKQSLSRNQETALTAPLTVKVIGIPADKTQLQQMITLANQQQLSLYTPSSVNKFKQILAQANLSYNNLTLRQREIDKIRSQLEDAIHSLVKKADKTALQSKIHQIETMDLSVYTSQSVDKIQDILKEAKIIFIDQDVSQEEVNDIVKKMTDEVNNLMKKANKNQLEIIYKHLLSKDLTQYSDESIKIFKNTLNEVKAILDNPNISQEEVDNAIKTLKTAEDKLVKKIIIDPTPDYQPETNDQFLKENNSIPQKVKTDDTSEFYLLAMIFGISLVCILYARKTNKQK